MYYLKKRKKQVSYFVLATFAVVLTVWASPNPLYGEKGEKVEKGAPGDSRNSVSPGKGHSPMVQGMIAKESSHPETRKKRSIWPFLLGGAAAAVVIGILLTKKKKNSTPGTNGNEGAVTTTGWGSYGTDAGYFRFPAGICLDSAGNVYVSDYDNTRIQKFTRNGQFISYFGPPMYSYNDFKPASSVIVNQTLYVCDGGGNARIILLDLNGTFLDKWQVVPLNPGIGLNPNPSAIAADSGGNLYVTEWYYQSVYKFSNQGMVLKSWGNGQGSGLDQFDFPEGVAVVNNEVFVADMNNKRVMVFDTDGHYIRHWATYNDYLPRDIVRGWNNRLLIISLKLPTSAGESLWSGISKYDLFGNYLGDAPTSFGSPSALAVFHQQNKIYVTDFSTHSVIVIDAF